MLVRAIRTIGLNAGQASHGFPFVDCRVDAASAVVAVYRRLLRLAVLLLVGASADVGTAREWTDASGSFRVQAELVTIREGKVYLEKTSGTVIQVPLEKLSKEDLTYLTGLPGYRAYFAEHPLPGFETSSPFVKIRVLDERKVGEIRRFGNLGFAVPSLAFSPNAGLLAIGKQESSMLLVDVDQEKLADQLRGLQGLGQITALAFTPDGRQLLVGGEEGRIQAWNIDRRGRLSESLQFLGHLGEVHAMTIAKDGQHMLSGSKDKSVRYWRLDTGAQVFAIDGFAGPVKAVCLLPDETEGLATDGQKLMVIDLTQGTVTRTLQLTESAHQHCMAISPDGFYAMVSEGYALRLWRISDGIEYPPMQDNESLWAVAFSPDSQYVISGGREKVHVWDVAYSRKIHTFDLSGGGNVSCVAYSPDRRHVAVTCSLTGKTVLVLRLPAIVASTPW